MCNVSGDSIGAAIVERFSRAELNSDFHVENEVDFEKFTKRDEVPMNDTVMIENRQAVELVNGEI